MSVEGNAKKKEIEFKFESKMENALYFIDRFKKALANENNIRISWRQNSIL